MTFRWQQYLADQAVGTTMNDVHALLQSAPLVNMVVPEMRSRNITMTYGGKSISPWNFIGTWPNAVELNQHTIEHGRMFNELDDENARNVCVIGTAVRDALFGSPEQVGREVIPVGEFININNQRFKIIGMFEHYESGQRSSGIAKDAASSIPRRSRAQSRLRQRKQERQPIARRFRFRHEEPDRLHPAQHDVAEIPRSHQQQQRWRWLFRRRPRWQ
jgi:hypothetical protein